MKCNECKLLLATVRSLSLCGLRGKKFFTSDIKTILRGQNHALLRGMSKRRSLG